MNVRPLLAAAVAAPALLLVATLPGRAEGDGTPKLGPIVAADTAFACDLYGKLRAKAKGADFFASPHSISSALAMTLAGARGDTAKEMARTLHVDGLGDGVHRSVDALRGELEKREQPAKHRKDATPFKLRIKNDLWGQTGKSFEKPFTDLLAQHYGAGMHRLDFAGDAEAARANINDAISEATADKIPELLQRGDVTEITRLVLTNAVYFKAGWDSPFEVSQTRRGKFHGAGGEVELPFMRQTDHYGSATVDGVDVVQLPYVRTVGQVAMVVIAPPAGELEAFEAKLSPERLTQLIGAAKSRYVDLSIPKFSVRTRVMLKETLSALGMPTAFKGGKADFSGMTGDRELFIGEVIHEAFVAVDEAGTEAAAATAVVMDAGGPPPEPVTMRIDRPFIFLIRDLPSGEILFMGRVASPTAG